MARARSLDPQILDVVLEGLRLQRQQLDRYITEAQRLLGGTRRKSAATVKEANEPQRKMSVAARKHIAAVQRKRWAKYRRQKAAAAKKQIGEAGKRASR